MQVAIPEPMAPLVEIARLNRILAAGTLGPVTLVSAPAGWGKTVATPPLSNMFDFDPSVLAKLAPAPQMEPEAEPVLA